MPANQLFASALNISELTVKVIMAAFNKKGEDGLNFSKFQQRGRSTYTVESGVVLCPSVYTQSQREKVNV